MKETIKIKIATPCDYDIRNILAENYILDESSDSPDYVICNESVLVRVKRYIKQCSNVPIRIMITGEPVSPDFNLFDYAVSFDYLEADDRHFRLPYFILESSENKDFSNQRNIEVSFFSRKFCSFIYSNPDAHPNRDKFFFQLSEYKNIDSFGKHLRNMSEEPTRKNINWFKDSIVKKSKYKFSIAFENTLKRGYTTEKILSSFLADSIPIYWGDPWVAKYFNPKAFINCHDYDSFDDVIKKIKELDNDNEKYLKMLSEPIMTEEQYISFVKIKKDFNKFIWNIFEQPIAVANRRGIGFFQKRQEIRMIYNAYPLLKILKPFHRIIIYIKRFL